ncbi:MAG: hypothetical protein IPK26_17090 [Planctomycetes bacterium]|nr:hypothetical protein [Planctomycetota bacterium]
MVPGRVLVVIAVLLEIAAAQSKPKPGSPHTIAVPVAQGPIGRAHGYTPGHYLSAGRYPLLIVLGDRGVAAATTIKQLPHAVLDRKQVVVVAPELGTIDYEPTGYARLQALVPAVIDAVGRIWSIDDRRVFLLGIGRGAAPALALARDFGDRFVAVAAFDPSGGVLPGVPRPGTEPALVVTPGGKAGGVADALAKAAAGQLQVTRIQRPEVAVGQGEGLLQSLLEWYLEFTLPQPENDQDKVKGRTVAAQGSKNRVICITGEFDTVEDVLTTLAIPHVAMDWLRFKDFDLSESDVLLINCSTGEAYGKVRAAVNKKLREFVQKGGYLFATDWSLRWPVSEVFSDYVGDVDPGTPDMKVDVRPAAAAANHELLQNVFPLDAPLPRWQIDAASFLFAVKQPARVEVLLESDELGAAYKGNNILGACFRVGAYGGLVLDVVSHFSHQGDGTPTTPMYQLIVNFIAAAKKHRQSRR